MVILTISSSCSKTICEANTAAIRDFNAGQYCLHSVEVLPVENTYFYVLRQYYDVNWRFTDSLDYYHCYDSTMVVLLNKKYHVDMLATAQAKADSLEKTPHWKKAVEYPGGMAEFSKYVMNGISTSGLKTKDISGTKIFIQFTVDTTGKVKDLKIMKGEINKSIDQQVLNRISTMTGWSPAYQFGKPVETRMVIPLQVEIQE
jgi:TonB family protein